MLPLSLIVESTTLIVKIALIGCHMTISPKYGPIQECTAVISVEYVIEERPGYFDMPPATQTFAWKY